MEFDAYKVKDELVQWIRDWFEENGPGCNAVIGISGGKDSSVVAALCVTGWWACSCPMGSSPTSTCPTCWWRPWASATTC